MLRNRRTRERGTRLSGQRGPAEAGPPEPCSAARLIAGSPLRAPGELPDGRPDEAVGDVGREARRKPKNLLNEVFDF
jgi:hypothetical protein